MLLLLAWLAAALASPSFITVPLAVPLGDYYFNAHLTDADGNEVAGRVDFLQPDVWLINGNSIVDCTVLQLYLATETALLLPLSFTAESETWNINECYLDGAYFPVTTYTLGNATVTAEAAVTQTSTYAVPYPNGVLATGVLTAVNFTLGTADNVGVPLDNFSFVLVSDTNKLVGGVGLAPHPQGTGLLDRVLAQGYILGHGYLAYFSDYANLDGAAGALLLGAVDKRYYTGSLYLFPQIPHAGWDADTDRPLPIVALDDLILRNENTSALVSLFPLDAFPLVLDLRLLFSFLPLDIIIQLAVQANAYYNSERNRWIVRCSDIADSSAMVDFRFGPLTVSIPLSEFMIDAYYGSSFLYFSDGGRACYLNILPSLLLGYLSLGLPFILYVYMAMDNEQGNLALANANPDLHINATDYLFLASALAFSTRFTASQPANGTVAYISSGYIPFATSVNASLSYTMTFFSANGSADDTIPSRLTGVVISSGEVYITEVTDTTSSGSATAANARTSSPGTSTTDYRDRSYVLYLLMMIGGIVVVTLA